MTLKSSLKLTCEICTRSFSFKGAHVWCIKACLRLSVLLPFIISDMFLDEIQGLSRMNDLTAKAALLANIQKTFCAKFVSIPFLAVRVPFWYLFTTAMRKEWQIISEKGYAVLWNSKRWPNCSMDVSCQKLSGKSEHHCALWLPWLLCWWHQIDRKWKSLEVLKLVSQWNLYRLLLN